MSILTQSLRSARGRDRLATVLRNSTGIVTVGGAARALDLPRTQASKLLSRWAEQGWLKRLRRGLYIPIPMDAVSIERTLSSPLILVPALFEQGYVGGWSAAEYWDLTEQIFREICVFNAKPLRAKRQDLQEVTFVVFKTRSEHLFGTTMIWEGQVRVPFSDPHRTIVDMLDRPSTGGGMRHVAACLSSYLASPRYDLGKLIEYADRVGNGAVFKRLGFLLERSQRDSSTLDACRQRMTTGNARLDPALSADHLVSRWRLWVPKNWERPSRD